MDYIEAYSVVLDVDGEYGELLAIDGHDAEAVCRKQMICEMILSREYDPWFVGSPAPNISKAIHRFCGEISRPDRQPVIEVQHAAALLAWTLARMDRQTDDSYLLLEHVMFQYGPRRGEREFDLQPWPELEETFRRWRRQRGVPPALDGLTRYERAAWMEILRWEFAPDGRSSDDLDGSEEVARTQRGWAAHAVAKALRRSLDTLQEAAEIFVRDEALLDTAWSLGYQVESIADLGSVPLPILDAMGFEVTRAGVVTAAVEGIGTGLGGLFLAAVDIPAVLMINLRSISQIAHVYGYETDSEEERVFILGILGVASSSDRLKRALMANLNKLALELATSESWKEVSSRTFSALLVRVAEQVGLRLTERKVAQLVPFVGAAATGGINYRWTHDNLRAARMIYRKRWLIEH